MDDTTTNSDGRTPQEELQYLLDNHLPLRETPLTKEERRQVIEMVLEREHEVLRMLADA